ncbi:MAG: G8 domain-containing protein [Phycisphaerales bacterium]
MHAFTSVVSITAAATLAPAFVASAQHQGCGHQMMHAGMMELVPLNQVTHEAVLDGDWFDLSTWDTGTIPGPGARVHIPNGITVLYDAVSDDPIRTVRVDGTMNFAIDRDTRLVVDTVVVTGEGRFNVGTELQPLPAEFTAEIVIQGDGVPNPADDPFHLGRGLIAHGTTVLHGADKLEWTTAEGDLAAGTSQFEVVAPSGLGFPAGWQIGDRLIIGGTQHDPNGSFEDGTRYHDEIVRVTGINGRRVTFEREWPLGGDTSTLLFDHTRPEGFESWDLGIKVGNLTRNVVVRTADPENVSIAERGHAMFMHQPDHRIFNTAFVGLGRTDKNRLIDDPVTNVDGTPGNGTNPRGRYGLHLHRCGLAPDCPPVLVHGNVVEGSPGWGIVHHGSHAIVEHNVVINVVGSGIVTEAGDETGRWEKNLVMRSFGDDDPESTFDLSPRVPRFDFGFNGEAYWLQGGGQVELVDNAAVSCAFVLNVFSGVDGNNNREAGAIPTWALPEDLQHIVTVGDEIDVTNVPVRGVTGMDGSNCEVGFVFWNHMRNTDGMLAFICPCDQNSHDERSLISDFRLWNMHGEGAFLQYSTQVDFVDGLILGDPSDPVAYRSGNNGFGRGHGISSNTPAQDIRAIGVHIEGFSRGMRRPREGSQNKIGPWVGTQIIDCTFRTNGAHLTRREFSWGPPIPYPDYAVVRNTTFDGGGSIPPVASFTWTDVGDAGVVELNANGSYDLDSPPILGLSGNRIAAYAWDLDGDGVDDEYGRVINCPLPNGPQPIRLTVWDCFGQSTSNTKTVTPQTTEYRDLVVDGGFDGFGDPQNIPDWDVHSSHFDEGWAALFASLGDDGTNPGTATIHGSTWGFGGVGQIWRTDESRRGEHLVRAKLRSQGFDGIDPNRVHVRIWGVSGEFLGGLYEFHVPRPAGAIPMNAELLLDATVEANELPWTSFQWPVDFGDGHEFTFMQITVENVNDVDGDEVGVDDVSITTAGRDCELDRNGDGYVGLGDLLLVLNDFNRSVPPGAAADMNGDGQVNIIDVVEVLSDWNCGL